MQDKTHTQEQTDGCAEQSEWSYQESCFACPNCEPALDIVSDVQVGWRRCADCNARHCRWKRGKAWKRGLSLARLRAPKGRKRCYLITLTVRDTVQVPFHYTPSKSLLLGGRSAYLWSPSSFGLEGPMVRTPPLIERWRAMRRTKSFTSMVVGGLWVAECTERMRNNTYQGVDGIWIAGHDYHVHPHIHMIVLGGGDAQGIPLEKLRKLCFLYGFGEPDVEQILPNKIQNKVGYLVNYLGKDQPVPRSRDTWGIVRKACSDVRKQLLAERKEQRTNNA